MNVELSDKEIIRYSKQIILRDFDFEGQEKLKSSKILIVGLGGLGCAASAYLASAGIGHLTLLDFDTVSLSNLNRQILHNDSKIGMLKAESAALQLAMINPYCKLTIINTKLDDFVISNLISQHDAIVDCSDNIDTREQINKFSFHHKVPVISGAAIRMEGQLSVFTWQIEEPCYRCISKFFGKQTEELSCMENGIIAPIVGVIGAMQAMETLKVLTSFSTSSQGQLLIYDARRTEFFSIKVIKNIHCEICN